jgi:hypothetical protein
VLYVGHQDTRTSSLDPRGCESIHQDTDTQIDRQRTARSTHTPTRHGRTKLSELRRQEPSDPLHRVDCMDSGLVADGYSTWMLRGDVRWKGTDQFCRMLHERNARDAIKGDDNV